MTDDTARAALLMSAVRMVLNDGETGDPDRLLDYVTHPSLGIVAMHRVFATLIEAATAVRDHTFDLREAVDRGTLAALVLLFGEDLWAVAA